MTAPAQSTKDWIQTVYIQITPRPKDHKGEIQADEITMASSYGQVPVVLKQPAPDRPRPKTKEPRLPGGVHVTCEDRVLVWNIAENGDRELSPPEISQCRNWLAWRWVPGWQPVSQ